MAAYLRELESRGKPVVFCGDLNVARAEMDLWGRHRENARAPGFTPEERESFASLLVGDRTGGGLGMVDTFRHLESVGGGVDEVELSRRRGDKNRGWRIDYVLVSAELGERGAVHERGYIRRDVGGSDHCPQGGGFVGSVRTRAPKQIDNGKRDENGTSGGFATVPQRNARRGRFARREGGF